MSFTFPVKASANNRYLTDQKGAPFLIMGEGTAQMIFQRLSLSDAATFAADRAARGFNVFWCHLCANTQDGSFAADGSTYDGIRPFTGTLDGTTVDGGPNYDFTTPNPTYFARVDAMINLFATYGITVFLDTFENDSYLQVYENNGNTRMASWGQYLANRYKSFANIVWMTGNDFQTIFTPSDVALAQNVMASLQTYDTGHLQTVELNFNMSGGLDLPALAPYVTLTCAYTYYPTYYEVLQEYNSAVKTVPVYLIETYYEGLVGPSTTPSPPSNLTLRKTYYWTVLAGGLGGVFYGSLNYTFPVGWQTAIDTVAVTQMGSWSTFFTSLPWYNLVPDQTHVIVTAGYGTPSGNGVGNIQTDNYVTTAGSADGALVIAYLPTSTTITVAMNKLSGSVTAQWFDPTNAAYSTVSGSPFSNTGSHNFVSPGNNSNGDPDWVLVLQAPGVGGESIVMNNGLLLGNNGAVVAVE